MSLVNKSILYLITGLIPSIVNFALIPYYLKHISLETFGVVSLLVMMNGFLVVFCSQQIHSAVGKFYSEHKDDTFQQTNVLSLLILPGNKYIVMGTKEGDLLLYNLAEASFCQQIEGAHKKEIWELAMHSSP